MQLTKKEYQSIWNDLLCDGFRYDKNLSWVLNEFARKTDLEIEHKHAQTIRLKLNKCLDRDKHGELVLPPYKLSVRKFVYRRSPKLSEALSLYLAGMRDKPDPSKYRWKKISSYKNRLYAQKMDRIRLNEQCNVRVPERDRTKKHCWKTVK